MSDTVLGGPVAAGWATVREVPAPGMVTLRGDLGAPEVATAVAEATGCTLPGPRGLCRAGPRRVAWMSPDELLLILPRAEVAAACATLRRALAGRHHLCADMSDARAMFRVEGAGAREALAKLCPVDLAADAFRPGEIRRSRLAQVPAAFWLEDEGVTLLCFRSVARYAFDVLSAAAAPGGEVGLFAR